MDKPRLLDLFCGAGGCASGYQMAGFHVTGVDVRPQPRYAGDVFVQGDALDYLERHGREFDAVHASPPCQAFSLATFSRPDLKRDHQDLVTPTLAMLSQVGKPWVVENVPRAPLPSPARLCGLMFGLKVFRHRSFASSFLLLQPPHPTHRGKRIGVGGMVCCAGHGDASWRYRGRARPAGLDDGMCRKAAWASGMRIDWMTRDEMAQAIPPAYAQFVGHQLMAVLANQLAAS